MKKVAYAEDMICLDDFQAGAVAKSQAVSLARMLSFALEEAKELGARDCEILISQGLRDLRDRYSIKNGDLGVVCKRF
jgi:hypothetical protein